MPIFEFRKQQKLTNLESSQRFYRFEDFISK